MWLSSISKKWRETPPPLRNLCQLLATMTNCFLSKAKDDIKLTAQLTLLKSVIQKDLDRLKMRAHGLKMRSNKIKHKVLHWDWDNSQYQSRLENEGIESSPVRRTWGAVG